MELLPKEIEAHYLQGGESERLSNEWGELERLRTQTILARYLPSAPAVILDVGGGAGAYAFPLAKQGYEVHLIDPVELHLEQARVLCGNLRSHTGFDYTGGRPSLRFSRKRCRCRSVVRTIVPSG